MGWRLLCLAAPLTVVAQRTYRSVSVLASGTFYKLGVPAPGIYRIDLAFLRQLGVNTTNLSSAGIRIYGNASPMLPEPCNGPRTDDLVEDAIDVEDGGDGVFGEGDYLLFYAAGPHYWVYDSVNKRFNHVKNLYSESGYYFLQVGAGGVGKRVAGLRYGQGGNVAVTGFDERAFHELDTFNMLSSGKDWYGEEFANIPGEVTTRSFSLTLPHVDSSAGWTLGMVGMARSVGGTSAFQVTVGGTLVTELDIPAVTDANYDVFGRAVTGRGSFRIAGGGGGGSGGGTGGGSSGSGNATITLNYGFAPGGYNAQGWLDWWEVQGRGILSLAGLGQMGFRDMSSVGADRAGSFSLQGADAETVVWDITDPTTPLQMGGTLTGSVFQFVNDCRRLHEYIAFRENAGTVAAGGGSAGAGGGGSSGGGNGSGVDPNGVNLGAAGFFTPTAWGKVENQNLHQASNPDLLVICDPALLGQAQRLAAFHSQQDGLRSLVVTAPQVFNEFGGGAPDPTALRDYVKMFYDRSGGDSTKRPRYLLLFGAGSFDYKDRLKGNTNAVPAYESASSLDPLNTYVSDDFYGFLRDTDDVNNINGVNLLDIGVGRIPARSAAEAAAVVDKITHYVTLTTQGPWRNEFQLVADDGDENLHLQDAEAFASTIGTTDSLLNVDKIYLDAYKETVTPAGGRYPEVNQAISSGLYNGVLVWNYTGHGSFSRLSNEDVFDQTTINGFNNPDKLPLFITATCDFAPWDNPLVTPIGVNLLVRPLTGAIALMTTTRLVFAFSNKTMNDNYLAVALTPKADGSYYSLGDAGRLAKNYTYSTSSDAVNNRKFTLVGDPALTLGFPRNKVVTTTINGRVVSGGNGGGSGGGGSGGGGSSGGGDTLKALNTYTITGAVEDHSGALLTGFNGLVYTTVYDKPRTVTTLGNNPGSEKAPFLVQDNVLYKGPVQAKGGLFTVKFVVPKDINYQYGKGRISYYAGSTLGSAGTSGSGGGSGGTGGGGSSGGGGIGTDGSGVYTGVIVGGSGSGTAYAGSPVIQAFLNDEKFVDGGITNQQPVLLLHLQDSLGINITGGSIGHDISAVLDNNTQNPFDLNGFYQADLGTYQKGTVRYPLPQLTDGEHVLVIKAWNVANVSSQVSLSFRVVSDAKLSLSHVLNYPNPFTTHTTFWFEHNRPGEELSVLVQILTVSGKLVKSIRRTINDAGNRSSEIDWDGRDDYGAKIGRGVYIYRLRVRGTDGNVAEAMQKLYIL